MTEDQEAVHKFFMGLATGRDPACERFRHSLREDGWSKKDWLGFTVAQRAALKGLPPEMAGGLTDDIIEAAFVDPEPMTAEKYDKLIDMLQVEGPAADHARREIATYSAAIQIGFLYPHIMKPLPPRA